MDDFVAYLKTKGYDLRKVAKTRGAAQHATVTEAEVRFIHDEASTVLKAIVEGAPAGR